MYNIPVLYILIKVSGPFQGFSVKGNDDLLLFFMRDHCLYPLLIKKTTVDFFKTAHKITETPFKGMIIFYGKGKGEGENLGFFLFALPTPLWFYCFCLCGFCKKSTMKGWCYGSV